MKLIDFLSVVDDNSNVVVVDILSSELCRYDGKDSIDEYFNDYDILNIYHKLDGIYVSIDYFKY